MKDACYKGVSKPQTHFFNNQATQQFKRLVKTEVSNTKKPRTEYTKSYKKLNSSSPFEVCKGPQKKLSFGSRSLGRTFEHGLGGPGKPYVNLKAL